MVNLKLCVFAAAIAFSAPIFGDEAEEMELELARQESFRAGMQEIVDDLNRGSTDRFVAAINQEDFVDRIFGLRLIDQRVKKNFRESVENQFDNMVSTTFSESKDGMKATLLGVESRGNRGRGVVRFDLPDFQFTYHEYDLQLDDKNNLVVVDWTDYLKGERFTDGMGMTLVMAAPSKPAVRKLIDYQNVRESDLFQFTELLKAARDRKAERFIEIINGLDERLQRQRVVVLTSVQLTKQIRSRRMMRTALIKMAQYYPQEPLYSLMLLDYYFPQRLFDEAYQALQRLHDKLGFEDAAMESRLSAAALVMGKVQDANAFADKAVDLEPGLELAWWSALRARAAASNFAAAVETLQALEGRFGHTLDREALQRDPGLSTLLTSVEYGGWLEAR